MTLVVVAGERKKARSSVVPAVLMCVSLVQAHKRRQLQSPATFGVVGLCAWLYGAAEASVSGRPRAVALEAPASVQSLVRSYFAHGDLAHFLSDNVAFFRAATRVEQALGTKRLLCELPALALVTACLHALFTKITSQLSNSRSVTSLTPSHAHGILPVAFVMRVLAAHLGDSNKPARIRPDLVYWLEFALTRLVGDGEMEGQLAGIATGLLRVYAWPVVASSELGENLVVRAKRLQKIVSRAVQLGAVASGRIPIPRPMTTSFASAPAPVVHAALLALVYAVHVRRRVVAAGSLRRIGRVALA